MFLVHPPAKNLEVIQTHRPEAFPHTDHLERLAAPPIRRCRTDSDVDRDANRTRSTRPHGPPTARTEPLVGIIPPSQHQEGPRRLDS